MERAMKSVAAGLNLPPRAPTPPGLTSRRSESDIASTASSQVGPDFGAALKPSKSNTETVSALKLAQDTACLFHRRFQDCIDLEKVIEEIAADHTMSHSKLMQTALGVREVSKQLQRRPVKRAARTIMIVTKARDNDLVYKTRELAEWLMRTPRYGSPQGVTVYVDSKLRNSKRFDAAGLLASNPQFESMLKYWTPDTCWTHPEKFDLVLTLGGDGTVLFTSWLFQRIVPPILSFSLGSLGFLTPFDFAHYREHLDRTMGGHSNLTPLSSGISTPATPPSEVASDAGMRVNMRMRFTCTVYRAPPRSNRTAQPEEISKFEVLNELVIDRGPSPYVSNLELFGDDEPLTVIQADGVIFSTPTGSTAYSLSAGGSLVHPDIPAILLTPICPHTLSFRPMLLNDTMALRIAVPRHSRATAYCSFDGKSRIELRQGDFVTIAASKYPFPTVVGGKMEWIDSVSRTLRWNTRQAQQKGWNGSKSSRPQGSSTNLATKSTRGLSTSSTGSAIPSRQNSSSVLAGSVAFGSSATLSRFRSDSDTAYDERVEDGFYYEDEEDVTDGEETNGVAEEFDIDIDEDDESPLDSKDSGYEGDAASNASWGGHGAGAASPARRGIGLMNLS